MRGFNMNKYVAVFVALAAFLVALAKLSPSSADDVLAKVLYRVALALEKVQLEA